MNTLKPVKPRLTMRGDQVTTTSLAVAEHFATPHKVVMWNVEVILSMVSRSFGECHFEIVNSAGDGQSMCRMTKQGFVLLTAGFVGKKANTVMEAYVRAFEMMEQASLFPTVGNSGVNEAVGGSRELAGVVAAVVANAPAVVASGAMQVDGAAAVFQFGNLDVRTFVDDKGEPWFLANDVCAVLDYRNPRDAVLKHCREKGVAKRDTLTAKGEQEATYINEGNLYRLIIKSRKSEAEKFESWVCDEVLPSIRKTGRYEAIKQAPVSAKPLGHWDVNDADFFLTVYQAIGRQIGQATLMVQLIKMGAMGQWVYASVRDIADATDGKLRKSTVHWCANKLKDQGLIDRQGSGFYIFEEALNLRLEQVMRDAVRLLPDSPSGMVH